MTDVTLSFNGRSYRLACAPGEETRLLALAKHVKGRLEHLLAAHGAVGDDRLLLMAAIQMADQLWEMETERDAAMRRAEAAEQALAARPEPRASRKGAPPAAGG